MVLSGIAIVVIASLGLLSPLALRDIFDKAVPQGNLQLLGRDVLILAAIPIVTGIISLGQTYVSSLVGQRVIRDLRSKLYRHLQSLSFRFLSERP
jgi:ATP-binding cassette subfamily B protein